MKNVFFSFISTDFRFIKKNFKKNRKNSPTQKFNKIIFFLNERRPFSQKNKMKTTQIQKK